MTQGREASVTFAISTYMTGYEWLAKSVTVAILAGFSSVILVMLLGQSMSPNGSYLVAGDWLGWVYSLLGMGLLGAVMVRNSRLQR